MSFPAPLKPILPFIKHAKQLERSDPVMSYYCKLYALQQGIPLIKGMRDDTAKKYLLDLMDEVESEKATLSEILDQEGMTKEYVERFALKVFKFADDEDRSGRANKGTAQSYYAAAIFIEVCSQFGELSEDLQRMKKYAKWKATDINQALKEGRTPVPGPPGGLSSEEMELQDELRKMEGGSANLFPPSPAASQPQPQQQQQQQQQPPPMDDQFGFPSVPKSTPSKVSPPPQQQQQQQQGFDDQFGFPSVPKTTPSKMSPPPQQQQQQQQQQGFNDQFGFPSVPRTNTNYAPRPAVDQHQQPPPMDDQFGFPSIPKTTPSKMSPPPPQQQQQQQGFNDQFGFPSVPRTNTNYAPRPVVDAAPAPAPVSKPVTAAFIGNIESAQKNCKFAASALNFDDTNTAIKHLLKALQDLTGKEYVPK